MNQSMAIKQAAKASKTQRPQFVVWVPDQGREIFNREQMNIWGKLVFVEAAFVSGVQVSAEVATA
ncbi:hypothetical protein [Ramlibacter sp.]|uniref:hypothetical protein n=1 Tax=Ramlibacter sp. TaxID=1917967 RepID=UPI002632E5C6|nr:hypothetical protein [Ramlibacter sp.]MDB5956749.1 hypothetical protein [Ramlibacter sp.]